MERRRRWTVYHRLILCISVFDLIMSLAYSFGSMPLPPETGIPSARGSFAACTAQGLAKQFGAFGFVYSACLVIYFMLMICYNYREEQIAAYHEKVMHGITIGLAFGTGMVGLAYQFFNPRRHGMLGSRLSTLLGCQSNHDMYAGCQCRSLFAVGRDNTGILGARAEFSVRRLLYQFRSNTVSVIRLVDRANETNRLLNDLFWVYVLAVTFLPLQGIWNATIFSRPRYLQFRKRDPDGSCWYAMKQSIWNPSMAFQNSSNRTSVRRNLRTSSFTNQQLLPKKWKDHSNHDDCNDSNDDCNDNVDTHNQSTATQSHTGDDVKKSTTEQLQRVAVPSCGDDDDVASDGDSDHSDIVKTEKHCEREEEECQVHGRTGDTSSAE
ncbi:expressed unknown protein [Seminavis robusta]|uniref:Uncharacterized protein n=1 Tax=Seminavis robusta TaxID=568900 RepID=A0A9N8DH34_9STRA|nr:expressed unknown protein [Seminavis robusta]|eukprot:Sro64_g036170.1 n/a (380) ;mRNA; f:29709-31162